MPRLGLHYGLGRYNYWDSWKGGSVVRIAGYGDDKTWADGNNKTNTTYSSGSEANTINVSISVIQGKDFRNPNLKLKSKSYRSETL